MPRALRVNINGVPQHLVHRGNNRQTLFFEPADYCSYRTYLKVATQRYECEVHAYVLMTNHVHLLATQRASKGIARMMQMLASRYATHINRRRSRTGTLWEGRYHASIIETDRYFLTCQRYIELNPVRAGIVAETADYPWSSYEHNALGGDDECVTAHAAYLALGRDPEVRRRVYQDLFREALSEDLLSEIRLALRENRPLNAASGVGPRSHPGQTRL